MICVRTYLYELRKKANKTRDELTKILRNQFCITKSNIPLLSAEKFASAI